MHRHAKFIYAVVGSPDPSGYSVRSDQYRKTRFRNLQCRLLEKYGNGLSSNRTTSGATMDYRPASNQIFETEVLTASPAKLRRMTLSFALTHLNRAIERAQKEGRVVKCEATLNVRESLDELLSGIRPSQEKLSHQVADLYVFLLKCLTAAEISGNVQDLIDLRSVLEIEFETWDQVVRLTSAQPVHQASGYDESSGSISFEA
ncbi:MAG: flagellar export chaperone FliS [Pirellulaceae bacterium]